MDKLYFAGGQTAAITPDPPRLVQMKKRLDECQKTYANHSNAIWAQPEVKKEENAVIRWVMFFSLSLVAVTTFAAQGVSSLTGLSGREVFIMASVAVLSGFTWIPLIAAWYDHSFFFFLATRFNIPLKELTDQEQAELAIKDPARLCEIDTAFHFTAGWEKWDYGPSLCAKDLEEVEARINGIKELAEVFANLCTEEERIDVLCINYLYFEMNIE